MKQIPLTKGYLAIVDDDDFDFLNQWKWSATENGTKTYACRHFVKNNKKSKLYMHRILCDAKLVDHANGDSLDNRKSNLRPADKSKNGANTKKWFGVFWNPKNRNWRSRISFKNKMVEVGSFHNRDEARRAYLKMKKYLFKEFAP